MIWDKFKRFWQNSMPFYKFIIISPWRWMWLFIFWKLNLFYLWIWLKLVQWFRRDSQCIFNISELSPLRETYDLSFEKLELTHGSPFLKIICFKKIEITQVHGYEEKFTDNKQRVIRRNSHKTTYRKQHNKRDGILMAINEIKKSNMEKH